MQARFSVEPTTTASPEAVVMTILSAEPIG